MTKLFITPNPQDFKLRIVWSVDASSKLVAEFSSCKWLPRIGETLVLPINETRKPNSWRKFKVFDIVYDFQRQTAQVFCIPVNWTPPNVKTPIQKIEEPSDRWEGWEKAFAASETTTKAEEPEHHFGIGHELYPTDEEDVDEEPKRAELLLPSAMPKFKKFVQINEEDEEDELAKLKRELELLE